jgi:ABC-type lipoprotein release transport system permease subunit
VANLLLARALARQLLVESVLLGLLGAGAAMLVALWAGPAVRALVLPAGSALSIPIDWLFLLLTLGLGLLTGVLAGILPALEGRHRGRRRDPRRREARYRPVRRTASSTDG